MDESTLGAGLPPENVPGVASKELVKKQSLELMRVLQEKNNPAQPFITVLGEGEDQMVILNKPINISKEGKNPSLARLMITSTRVVALDAPYTDNYVDGTNGIRTARKEGVNLNAIIKKGYPLGDKYSLLITPENSSNDGAIASQERPSMRFLHNVPVLEMDFQDREKIQQAIRESYQEAKDLDQPKIKLLTGLSDFAKTLGENLSIPPQPPTTPGPTT